MEVTINNRVFIKSLEKMKKVLPTKQAQAILSCFLLEARDTEVVIFATDINIGLQETIPASVAEEGTVCLPLLSVLNAMKSLPKEEDVCLLRRGSSSTVSFTCRDTIFRISSGLEDTYPDFPECVWGGKEKYISVNMLSNLFKYVDIAVPWEEQPLYLAPPGALLEWKQDSLEIAGTDGHRMVYIKKECFSSEDDISEMLPKKLLQIFPKVIGKVKSTTEADLHVIFSDTHVVFEYESLKIFSKLLENKFPEFKHRLRQSLPIQVVLHREVFKSVIMRASAASKRDAIPTRFTFLHVGKLVLDVETEDSGNFHDEMTINYQKEEFSVGANSCFILDFLRSINSSFVFMQLSDDGKSPIIFSPCGEEDYKYVIMPIDLSKDEEG